ncbi:hypothetical protein BTHE_1936 [Bifidobacterium thermophilum]|nr:hypothetical protein BTHE_1936 [Bifidobacterium thermophilum]
MPDTHVPRARHRAMMTSRNHTKHPSTHTPTPMVTLRGASVVTPPVGLLGLMDYRFA